MLCSPPQEAKLRLGSVAAALVDSPQGYVYKHIEKLDTDKRAYGCLPLMASSSGGQIGFMCRKRFSERIFSEANNVCHNGEYASRYRGDNHVACVRYESRIHTTHA